MSTATLSSARGSRRALSALGLLAVLGLTACGKGGAEAAPAAAAPIAIDDASFAALTDPIQSGQPWDATAASIDKLFGPAKVKTETRWIWAIANDDDCWEVKLDKNGDKTAGWGGGRAPKGHGDGKAAAIALKMYTNCANHAQGRP